MAKFTAEILADWNADGDYSDANEDLTGYVKSMTYNHQQNLDRDQMSAGVLTVVLNNDDHRFSKPKGTITGLLPGRTLWARLWYPYDDFAGTNDTNLTAHTLTQDANWTWVSANNNFQLNGSGAARTSTTSGAHLNYLEFSDTDIEIATSFRRGTDSTDHGGLLFRYVDANNYGYLRVTGSAIEFRKVIGGTDSQIATKSYTWADNTTKLLQLRIHGTVAVVLVDGVQIQFGSGNLHLGEQSVADAGINAGTKHGLFCGGPADHTWLKFGGYKSLLHGFIESIVPRPSKGSQYCYIKAHDDISEQQKTEIHYINGGGTDYRLDQSLNLILSSIGWRDRYQLDECSIGMHNIYEGVKTIDMFAQDAIMQVQLEEDGLFYVDGDGYTRLESRAHRDSAPHNASKATYRDNKGGTDPYFTDMAWEDGDSGIENRNIFAVRVGEEASALATVWSAEIDPTLNPLAFDASEVKEFEWEVDSQYDFTGTRLSPAATTDYTANTLANGGGTDLTSGITVASVVTKALGKFGVTKITWGATAGFLTKLQQRAQAFTFTDWSAMINEDATSITAYRDRFKKIQCLFIDTYDMAEAVGAHRLARKKDPKTRLTLTVQGADKTTAHAMIQRRISDLVTCIYSDMGINDTFFIEGESWTIDQAGYITTQTLQLREA